jgi:cell division protein FtsN
MQNLKNKPAMIGIIIAVIIILIGIFFMFSDSKARPRPVPCAIGERFNTMTGKPCPLRVEEAEPASTTNAVDPYHGTRG